MTKSQLRKFAKQFGITLKNKKSDTTNWNSLYAADIKTTNHSMLYKVNEKYYEIPLSAIKRLPNKLGEPIGPKTGEQFHKIIQVYIQIFK